jgi:hypothetical protein
MANPTYYDGELTVTPALSKSDAAIFTTIVTLQTSSAAKPVLAAIKRQNTEMPYYGDLLEVSEDGTTLFPEEGDSNIGLEDWLALLLVHFFIPRGYELSGSIDWNSDEDFDHGTIYVKGDKVEAIGDVVYNSGPSWDSKVFLSPKATEMVRELLNSANGGEGLAVVSVDTLKALAVAVTT